MKTFLRVLNNDSREWIFQETRQETLLYMFDYEPGPRQKLIGVPLN